MLRRAAGRLVVWRADPEPRPEDPAVDEPRPLEGRALVLREGRDAADREEDDREEDERDRVGEDVREAMGGA